MKVLFLLLQVYLVGESPPFQGLKTCYYDEGYEIMIPEYRLCPLSVERPE